MTVAAFLSGVTLFSVRGTKQFSGGPTGYWAGVWSYPAQPLDLHS